MSQIPHPYFFLPTWILSCLEKALYPSWRATSCGVTAVQCLAETTRAALLSSVKCSASYERAIFPAAILTWYLRSAKKPACLAQNAWMSPVYALAEDWSWTVIQAFCAKQAGFFAD